MDIPSKLYKYESFSTQSLANLKNGNIYFSLPNQFNDPFDCSLPINLDLSLKSIDSFRDRFIARGGLPENSIQQLKAMSNDELLIMLQKAAYENIEKSLSGKGVSCFSNSFNNLLMWSHYGEKHTGFCLEFDSSYEPFNKAKKVKYINDFPKLNAEEMIIDINCVPVLELLHTKAKPWEYENEWRCIHAESPIAFTYPQESLVGVYFGSEMNLPSIEIICLILQGQNSNIRFWRGNKCNDKFDIEFKEFFYTSYLKSKEYGVA
jgi:hypothetical protein